MISKSRKTEKQGQGRTDTAGRIVQANDEKWRQITTSCTHLNAHKTKDLLTKFKELMCTLRKTYTGPNKREDKSTI